MIWAMVMTSLPSHAAEDSQAKWTPNVLRASAMDFGLADSGQSQPELSRTKNHSTIKQASIKPPQQNPNRDLPIKSKASHPIENPGSDGRLLASAGILNVRAGLDSSSARSNLAQFLALPALPRLSALPAQAVTNSMLQVSVAFADNSSVSANFPEPWNESNPLVSFIGGGTNYRSGAIRLDNPNNVAVSVDSVTVDLGRPGPVFQLWTNITVPANGSAILAQTADGNFNTSASPVVGCGQALANETRIPKITVTIAGASTSYLDTAHVLDTGGFDSSCRGNQSLGWRAIGAAGIEAPAESIQLTLENAPHAVGTANTLNIQVNDAGNQPLANVPVALKVVNGPNSGKTFLGTTDGAGNATVQYSSTTQGTDLLQAVISNLSGGVAQSQQVSTTWTSAAACPPPAQNPAATQLAYIGQTTTSFGNPITLAALLTDGTGNPLSRRTISLAFAGQAQTATTDANGVASVAVSSLPVGVTPIAISFAGDQSFQAAQLNSTVTVQPAATLLRYTGTSLFTSLGQQTVSAVLTDAQGRTAIANRTVSFVFNGATVSGTTDANGAVTAAFNFQAAQTTGTAQLQISFAGDADYQASSRAASVAVFQTTSFVIWGGNSTGLKIGQRVNFFGHDWPDQIQDRELREELEFNGFALLGPKPDHEHDRNDQPPPPAVTVISQCQALTTSKSVTPGCWHTADDQNHDDQRPPKTLPSLIEVIVSTAIRDGDDHGTFGNIACGAVLKVEPRKQGDDKREEEDSQDRFGVIIAVNGNCAGVFPPPAVLVASQQQPSPVLPGQQAGVTYNIANQGGTDATNVTLTENFDQLTPSTGSATVGTVAAGASASGNFSVTIPAISGRQSGESTVDYESRLAASDGRLFTSEGEITFTDPFAQLYPPLDISSFSRLSLPRLEVGLSGANCIAPGTAVTYSVRVNNVGSAKALQIGSVLTLPDNSTAPLTVPDLPAGTSFIGTVNWPAPGVAAKSSGESTQSYLARLAALDGTTLPPAVISATWLDALSNAYGPVQQPFTSLTRRVPIVSTTVPTTQSLLPNQKTQFSFTASNNGSGNAVQVILTLKRQDGSLLSVPNFSLPGGQSGVVTANYASPAIAPKGTTETDAAYLGRLASSNGTTLSLDAILNWKDSAQNTYGPTDNPFTATAVLPILNIALTGPATAQAGSSITYGVVATNTGTAVAPAVTLALTLPNGTVQQLAAGPLVPSGTFQTTVSYAIPATQAAGPISAQLSALWNDSAQNSYGPLSSLAATTVTSRNTLTLAPVNVGPDVTGTTQTMTAALRGPTGTPISGVTVQFVVSGANSATGSAITDALGTATFTYTGAKSGTDSVVASSGGLVSNSATVSWLVPVQNVSTSTIFGRFFASDGSGGFDTPPTATPAFTQTFPTINFNPPGGTIPGNTSGVGEFTRPFTDVTTDLNGNFTGTIVAQGNGLQAGANTLFQFQAVFTSVFTIAGAGDVTFSFFSDDGFIFGVGGGATRVSGPLVNVPASGVTPFETLTVVGAFNIPTGPVANTIVVHFPAAGSYPYEVDYSECCGGQIALTMASGQVNSKGVPPSGSMVISPNSPPTLAAGQTQTFSVQAFDSSGAAVQNLGVALIVNGANAQSLSAITDSTGRATFSYSAVNAGTDTVQAIGNISGLGAISNIVTVNWSVPAGGGGTGGTTVFAPQGWIGQPLIGTTLQGQLPITIAPGISLTSGTLEFWPTAHPNDIHVINSNTTGSGTVGVFDGGALANGGYTIQLQATASNGAQQTSVITVNVIGESKPGRVTTTITDLQVPLGGFPITIARTYDSLKRSQVEDFGFGWALSVGVDLAVDAANNVTFTLNGQRQTFFFQPQASSFLFPWLLTPTYTPQSGLHGTLTSDGCGGLVQVQSGVICFPAGPYQPTTFTYTDIRGTKYVIGADGTLHSVQDINGNTLTVTPGGITGKNGINVPFQRDSQGRITQITDPLGHLYRYTYDASGNLASVNYPGISNPTSYTYDPTHQLTGGTDPNNHPLPAKTYDTAGRLSSETDALGHATSYSYTTATVNGVVTNTTVITNPPDANGNIGTITNVYDSFGRLLISTDPLGHTVTNIYDTNHNLISTTDPLNHTVSYVYDARGNQTSVAYPKTATSVNTTSTTAYNQFSQPTSHTDQLGNVRTVTYDDNFSPQSITDTVNGSPAVIESFHYNPDGTKQADALGFDLTVLPTKATTYTYDANGNLASETDPLGRTTSYSYDNLGLPRSLTRPLPAPTGHAPTGSTASNTTSYLYDDFGRLIEIDEPLGRVTKYVYDNNGNKSSATDPNGNTTTYQYDALNRLILTTFPTKPATTESRTYDFRGNLLDLTDEAGHVTHNVYDLAGRLISVTTAFGTGDASTSSYTYYDDGRKKTQTDPLGNPTTYVYDEAGRLTSITDALGHQATNAYDDVNRLIAATDPNHHTVKYSYDSRGRQQVVTYPDSTTSAQAYDSANNLLSVTDQAAGKLQYTYDDANQLLSAIQANHPDPAHNTTTYTYDNLGDLATRTDANGHATRQVFDVLGEVTSETFPAGGSSQVSTYDLAGNLLTRQDFNGKITSFSYDTLNQLIGITPDPSLSQPAVSFTYSPTGRIATMTDAGGTISYTYDNQDRVTAKAAPAGTLTYTYDAAGNLTSMASSHPNGVSVSYTYDRLNRLSTVTDNRLPVGKGTSVYTYDAAGNLATMTLPNGVVSTFTYDNLDRLKSLQAAAGTNPAIASFGYQLDPTGNRTAATELSGRSVQWNYDGIYRLTSEAVSQDPNAKNGTASYGLDPVGNRLSTASNLFNISSGAFTFDANDFLGTEGYDSNGNVTAGAGRVFTYDFRNRLIKATNLVNNTQILLAYDALGNRISKIAGAVTTQYLIDEQNPTGLPQVVEEVVNGTVQRTYAYGYMLFNQSQLTNGASTPSFYGYDGGGNVRFMTNASGAVTDAYDYDAFGNLINISGNTPNNYLYRGEQFDSDLGLYYLRARYYNPLTGRFLGRDTNPGDTKTPQDFHKYSYAWSNPVNLGDPTGFEAEEEGLLSRIVTRSAPAVLRIGLRVACILNGISDAFSVINLLQNGDYLQGGVALVYLGVNLNSCRAEFRTAGLKPGPPKAKIKDVYIDPKKYPEAAKHAQDAIKSGKPDVLTVDRSGAAGRRADALRGKPTRPGTDRDEYPPAFTKQGGADSSVRNIPPGDNRGAGSSIGHQTRDVPDGGQIRINIGTPPPRP
jgi:RHS repeat-associated protein/uncharacterized repeat protein (TIGR01451 family)